MHRQASGEGFPIPFYTATLTEPSAWQHPICADLGVWTITSYQHRVEVYLEVYKNNYMYRKAGMEATVECGATCASSQALSKRIPAVLCRLFHSSRAWGCGSAKS